MIILVFSLAQNPVQNDTSENPKLSLKMSLKY